MWKQQVVGFAIAVASAASWALPSLQQIESEVQQGHTAQAEAMMGEVVAAKPDSAKAHYVYAEILARNAKFTQAADEAKRARQIDPDIRFTQPEKFKAFEQLLEREQHPSARTQAAPVQRTQTPQPQTLAPARSSGGVPGWVWIVGLGVVGYFLWRGFSRSRGAMPMGAGGAAPGAYGGQLVPGNGPMMPGGSPYGAGMPGAAPGGGLLKTGLAVAGGVAGGMLIDEMLHRHNDGAALGGAGVGAGGYEPAQGMDPATELETRQVDFGNGNDWDAGGGSIDVGGGGGSDGGWD